MIKDVKRKIIISVASVLLLAAAIGVVPLVQAAGAKDFTATGTKATDKVTYKYTIANDELKYSGVPVEPAISAISITDSYELDAELKGAYIDFNSVIEKNYYNKADGTPLGDGVKPIAAGEYTCKIRMDSSVAKGFSMDEASFDFKIVPSNFDIIKVKVGDTYCETPGKYLVLTDSSGNATPNVTGIDIEVRGENGIQDITLDSSQFTVSPITASGEQKVNVTITDTANLSAADLSDYTKTLDYIAAYSLDNLPSGYTVEFNGTNSAVHTGLDIPVALELKCSGSPVGVEGDFTTDPAKVKAVGKYDVMLKPSSKSKPYVKIGGVYFAGTCTKEFTVTGKDTTSLRLWGVKPTGGDEEIISEETKVDYRDGNPVTLLDKYSELFVTDVSGKERIPCSFRYSSNTGVGYGTVEVIPDSSSGYVTPKAFKFLIIGDLQLSDYRFKDTVTNSTKLFYTGNNRYIDGTPRVTSGGEKVISSNYELYYQYESETGEWLPEGGYSQAEMTGSGGDKGGPVWTNMATPGNKKVLIKGKNTYDGKSGELFYTISRVELPNNSTMSNEFGEFKVTVTSGSSVTYNGKSIEAGVEVKYKPNGVDAWVTLTKDIDYEVSYSDNINAGRALIHIKGIGSYSGECTRTFTITPLAISSIIATNSSYEYDGTYYVYNRNPIRPYFKIAGSDGTTMNLVEGLDYTIKYRDYSEYGIGQYPSDAETYAVTLTWLNRNIEGISASPTYTIAKATLSPDMFTVDGTVNGKVEWDGKVMQPGVTPTASSGLTDSDFVVKGWGANSGVTTDAVVRVEPKGKNYGGAAVDVKFEILPRTMNRECITASGSINYNESAKKYEVTLKVTDSEANKPSLVLGTDYTVIIRNKKTNEIVYQGDDTAKIVLDAAGTYTIEINGKNNYTGNTSKPVEVECGINLEDYYLYIPVPGDRNQAYAFGDEVNLGIEKIKILDSYGVDQSSKFTSSSHLDKLKIQYYNLTKYPKGDTQGYTNLVGQIFISAIPSGKDNTIYGETGKVYDDDGALRLGTYYEVVAAKWNQTSKYLRVVVNGDKDLVYAPTELRDDIPEIKVYYDPDGTDVAAKGEIELQLGVDYEIRYKSGDIWTTEKSKVLPAYLNSGSHYYKIVGIGNYAASSNEVQRYYNIAKAEITQDWVDKNAKVDYLSTEIPFRIDYTIDNGGTPESQGIELVSGVDYTIAGPFDDLEGTKKRKYTVSTKSGSNYVVTGGSINVEIDITASNLGDTAPFENGFEEAKEGEIYVVWEKPSLDIKDHYKEVGDRNQIKPSFTLIYMIKKGDTPAKSDTKELKAGIDYVTPPTYGPNKTVGEDSAANFVRITGMGGFLPTEVNIPCTLYYPLLHVAGDENNEIKFTKTKGNIYPDATVVDETFKSLTAEQLANLVVMNYNDGSRSPAATDGVGGLNMAAGTDYVVEVLSTTSGIGTKKIRITGTEQAPNYFRGSFSFDITTTGDLSNAKVQVGNKTNNEVEFDTKYLTDDADGLPDGLPIKVTLGGKTLKKGVDYELKATSVNHPNGLGIGHVHIEGKAGSDYEGTSVDADYTVVATLNSNKYLKFEIKGNDGTFHNDNGINTELKKYPYQNGTEEEPGVRPEVQLSLINLDSDGKEASQIESYTGKYLTTGDSAPDKDYLISYSNNNGATKNAGVIFKASGVENSYLRGTKTITFEIQQTSLDPNKNTQLDVTWNHEPKYNGRPLNAKSLNLIVKDLNCTGEKQTLVEGVDYTLNFEGRDNTNVTNQIVLGYIVAKEKGNYVDRYPIEIKIKPWSFENDEMTNDDVEMVYTGKPITEDEIGPSIVLNQGGEYTRELVYPTDFTITGFVNSAGTTLTERPKDVGEYQLTLTGRGNYTGTMRIHYEITPLDLTNATITFKNSERCPLNTEQMPDCTYDGHVHEPAILVKYQNRDLTQGIDYDVEYADNINAGIAKVVIKVVGSGTQNYIGTQEKKFQIQPKNITDKTISFSEILEEYPFTMKTVHPGDTMTITDTSIEASIGLFYELRTNAITTPGVIPDNTDYIVTYVSDNAAKEAADKVPTCSYAGHVQMTVTGCGNYTGTKKYDYYIGTCIDVAEPIIINTKTEYNGLYQPPVIEEVKKNKLVLADDEFTVAAYKGTISKENLIDITKIVDAGTYKITVAGVPEKGTYTKNPKSQTVYTVEPRSITSSEVSGFDGMYYYTGKAICPKGIIVTDIGLPVSDADFSAKKNVQLRNKVDYEVAEYKNNVNAGKATIVIEGIGNYTGKVYGYFTIDSSNVSGGESYDESSVGTGTIASKDGSISIAATDITLTYDPSDGQFMRYTGYSVRPGVMFKDYKYNISDFYVTVQNSVDPGIATMIISGDGNNFTGSIKLNYIIKADLSKYGKIAPIADQVYTGNAITPPVTIQVGGVILRDGTDYSLSYVNNTNVGKATVKATATNNKKCFYYGSIQGDFNISNAAGGMQVSGYATSYAYTGSPIAPEVVVSMNNVPLTKGTDYTVTYKNNTNVGVASITVTGIGKYSGSKTVTFTIGAKNIENCITSQISNQEYTGRTYTPVISVSDAGTGKTLISGSDYILTYSNNTNPGTATVTIQAIGKNYTGTKTVNFKITSAAVTGLKVYKTTNHTATLSWSKQSYADGYQICNKSNRVIGTTTKNSYTVNNLASAKTYSYKVRSYVKNADGSLSYGDFSSIASGKTLLNTPKLRVDATGNGVITLRWTKIKKATGYEIYYSTSKNGTYYKLASISKNANRIFNDKGLARGEVYYYTIRAYRNVSGKKIYSNYNTIQKATVR